jgi:hypothetical protein
MFAVAMIVVLVLISIFVVVKIAKDGSTKTPAHAAPVTGSGVTRVLGLTSRAEPATAWTGNRLFVFGGTAGEHRGTLVNDGALVDVMTGETFALPSSPFAAPPYHPVAARSGDTVLVMGIECPSYQLDDESGDGALCAADGTRFTATTYDVTTGDWKTVNAPPGLPAPARQDAVKTRLAQLWWAPETVGVARDGSIVVNLGQTGPSPSYWAFTPTTMRWRHLGDPLLTGSACVTGDQLVALTTKFDFDDGRAVVDDDPFLDPKPGGLSVGPNAGSVQPTLRFLDIAAPGASWQPSPTLTGVTYPYANPPRIFCMGSWVMVVGSPRERDRRIQLYDTESRTWSTPSAPPSPPAGQLDATSLSSGVWTGTELLFINPAPARADGTSTPLSKPLPGVAYNPTTSTWRRIPSFGVPPSQPRWTGDSVVDFVFPFAVHDAT